jgi:hypothetical protein
MSATPVSSSVPAVVLGDLESKYVASVRRYLAGTACDPWLYGDRPS